MEDFVFWIGIVATLAITAANVPQVIKIVKTGDVKSISLWTYLLLVFGNASWLVYGIKKSDVPIMLGNAIAALLCLAIVLMKLFPKLLTKAHKKARNS